MKMYKAMTWQHETTGTDGNVQLFGVNIFGYPWKDTGERVEVKSPNGTEQLHVPVYQTVINGEVCQFAAAELSNCVWDSLFGSFRPFS